jgi:hypothetical protein
MLDLVVLVITRPKVANRLKHDSLYTVRMSWAANRKTTRPEDSAFCLMGLVGVQMPLLYEEESENVFLRLQYNIILQISSNSLLA